jgi:ATP-binding cassette subfamily C (CFTR/MRP) protein 4
VQKEEELQHGSLSWRLYLNYFRTGMGVFGLLICVLLNLAAHISYILCDWWLAVWSVVNICAFKCFYISLIRSKQSEERLYALEQRRLILEQNNTSNVTLPEVPPLDNMHRLGIFAAITFSTFLLGVLRSFDVFHILVSASKNIHNEMFACIIRCPSRFFDTNPVGKFPLISCLRLHFSISVLESIRVHLMLSVNRENPEPLLQRYWPSR